MNRKLLPLLAVAALCGCTQSEPETTTKALVVAPPAEEKPVASDESPTDNAELEEAEAVSESLAAAGPTNERGIDAASGEDAPQPATDAKVTGKLAGNKSAKGLESALNTDAFGTLGSGAGIGGLGLHGAGKGGGGTALGRVQGISSGSGYGRGAGSLGERRSVPRIRVGSAGVAGYSTRGIGVAPAPPSREPVSTESYKDYGTNRFTDPTEDRFSTFSIDVDTGSYTIARRKLNEGSTPPKAAVRVEEFVNYFGYNYPKPKQGAFSVSMEAAPSPFATDGKTHLLRVGVQGKTIPSTDRKPVHLTFLVDVSGSMMRQDKIGYVKKSLKILTNNLKEGDTVAMATYAGRTEILLEPTRVKGKIYDAIDRLSAGGSTAMASGLDLAYRLAEKNLAKGHENRVIVLSDGDANVGRTGWQEMLDQISGQVKKGVTLSTIGFGMGNYQDTTMEQLANKGNGNYYYVDSEKEALRIFGDQLDGTLQVIAKDVKLQVEFNPAAVHRYRLVGYENRDIADKDFRNDKVDAGEIGAGHTVTALYEVQLKSELPDRIATVRVRHKEPHGSDKASEQSFAFNKAELNSSISKSSKDFQFAAAVAAFAEKLRESPYATKLTYAWILEIAEGATQGRKERKEFVQLVRKARRA